MNNEPKTNEDDLLKGAYLVGRARHQRRVKADIEWAIEIEVSVIAAGQQILVSDYDFDEPKAAEWAEKTLKLAQLLFQMMKGKQSPANDKEFAKLVAKTVIDGGVQALQTTYQFTPDQATEWAKATLNLVTQTIQFARRKKKPLKPKVRR